MSKKKIKIIRSAVGCMASMGLINELKKKDVEVIGIDCDPTSVGLYLSDKGYVVPRADKPEFLNSVLSICEIEKPDAILSGPEEEIIILSRNKKLFEDVGVLVLCPDYDTVEVCTDKFKTYQAFKRYGVPQPDRYEKNNVKYPCIIKPLFGRGGKGIYEIKNEEEFESCLNRIDGEFIIQEFVQGTEYTVDILADMDGNPLSIVPRIRLKTESGISVKAMTVRDREIIDYCDKIVRKIKLKGPSCIQCIKNKDGIKFLEINPRFGGGSILSIKADKTIIPNLIKMIKGENPIPSTGFQDKLVMLRYYSEYFIKKKDLKNKDG